MSEKKMGRKFKVGDKVKFTEKAIDSDVFHSRIKTGDVATIVELEKGLLGEYPSKIVVESLQGELQFIEEEFEGIEEWFVKNSKKKRKHFRMGDFVKLKDGACLEEDSIFGDITHSAIGVVCGMGHDGALEVHFTTETGYDFDRVYPKALRLATKEERKTLRKLKVAKITYDKASETEQDIEVAEAKIPPEYDVKVGDIVEVTQYYGGYPVGTIGQVDTIDEDIEGYHNHVVVRSTDEDYWNECNVKLLYRPNMKVCSTLNYNVKVGDIVEVTEDVLGHSVGKLGEVTELFCPDNPETRNIATVIDFSGETHIERNVKLAYRKPETKSK